ncbi:MAG: hypothetical protein E4G91_00365 [Candidatus Zixiibacteriota bacterium]|nr:MAG: hypothetical protein E4G91_00365 [candidate division Zixibacteria bacterium]
MEEFSFIDTVMQEPHLVFWPMFFLWLASFVITDYFRESLPAQTPSGLGDFTIPTATEGRYVPLIFGTMVVQGPNVVWYGDFRAQERTVTTGIIFKKDEVIGFTYHLGLQMGLCRGRTAGIRRIWVGDDIVWDYNVDQSPAGVLGSVIDIDRDDLFGGADNGGGMQGRIRLFDGSPSQGFSDYLSGIGVTSPEPTDRITNLPSYRGYSYVTFANIATSVDRGTLFGGVIETEPAETGGANIGESNQLRNLKFELQMFNTIANGGLGDALSLGNDHHFIGDDINPISLAYEAFTNTDWGRGLSPSDVNLTNFKANAETIWSEGLGFSMIVDQVMKVSELIDQIEQHIDGYIGPNPVTGQLEVNLARQDYTLASELQLNETNIISIPKFARSEGNQTFNELRVQYTDREKQYKDGYAPAQDLANLIIQGRPRSRTQRYPGVHTAAVANLIVWRDLRGMARSLASMTIETNRVAWDKRPGDIVSVTDAEVGVTNLPCRIIAVRQGDPVNASIILDVVEDIFGSEFAGFSDPPASEFIPPTTAATALAQAAQLAIEAPFNINIQDTDFPTNFPRLFTGIRSAVPVPLKYEINVDQTAASSPTGFDVEGTITNGATTVGTLRDALTGWQDGNGTFSIGIDPLVGPLEELVGPQAPGGVGSLTGVAVINPNTATEEWILISDIAFLAVSPDALAVNLTGVYRAGLDTAMHSHSAGEPVWFIWTGGTGIADPIFPVSNTLDVKLLPITQTGRVNLTDSPVPASALPVVIASDARYAKPLLPVDLAMNGTNFPTTDVDFDTINTPTIPGQFSPDEDYQGVQVVPTYRWFRVENVIWQVNGLDLSGLSFDDAEVQQDQLRVSWWLYNLDDTPSPTRGVDEIDSATNVVLTGANDEIRLLKSAIASQLDANTFNARLEIETSHKPEGMDFEQSPELFRASREPLFFDFTGVGVFVIPLESIAIHLQWDGEHASREIHDVGVNNITAQVYGNGAISNVESVFGGTSGHFPDDIAGGSNAEWSGLRFPYSAFGSPALNMQDDWTIECRMQFEVDAFADRVIFSQWEGVSGDLGFYIFYGTSSGLFTLSYSPTGSGVLSFTLNPDSPVWKPSPVLGAWYALTIQRKDIGGGSFKYDVFIDGTRIGGVTNTVTWNESVQDFGVGIFNFDGSTGPNNSIEGYIDEFRLTTGFAIYGLDYTIATERFPTQFDPTPLLASFDPLVEGGVIDESVWHEPLTFGATTDITPDSPFTTSPDLDQFWSLRCNGVNDLTPALGDGAWLTAMGALSPITGFPQFNFGTKNFTMECFVKFNTLPNTTTDGMALLSKYNRPPASQIDWYWHINSSNEMVWSYSFDSSLAGDRPITSIPLSISTGVWYHTAVTRVGNDLCLWWDGELIGVELEEFASGERSVQNVAGQPVAIGRFYDASVASQIRALDGWITEPRIVIGTAHYIPSFLSASPLSSPIPVPSPMPGSPAETYTIPTAPFTKPKFYGRNGKDGLNSGDLKFLSHWDSTDSPVVDEAQGAVITLVGSARITAASPVIAKFGPSSLELLNPGSPIAYATVPDDFDWSISFNNADFTLETWVNFNSLPTGSPEAFATFFGQWNATSSDFAFRFGYSSSDGIVYEQSSDGTAGTIQRVSALWSASPETGVWHHFAASKKNGWVRLFADGILIGQSAIRISTPNVTRSLGFGASNVDTTPDDFLDGYLDETRITGNVALYTENFTPETKEFDWHRTVFMPGPDRRIYEWSRMTDYSYIGASVAVGDTQWHFDRDIVKFGLPSPDPGDFNPASMQCDNGASIEFTFNSAQLLLAGEFTIEAFVRFNTNPQTVAHGVMGHYDTPTIRSWALQTDGSGNWRFIYSTDGSTDIIADFAMPSPFTIDTWYHIAVTRDNSGSPELLRLFVDGVEQTPTGSPENVVMSGVTLASPTTDRIVIGAITPFATHMNGYIEEPRVMKGKALYTSGFTPPTLRHPRY